MYSVERNNVFIALVATSFGRCDHHQANAIQNVKAGYTQCIKCQTVWDPIYINVSIC
jgi:hypothetical protein